MAKKLSPVEAGLSRFNDIMQRIGVDKVFHCNRVWLYEGESFRLLIAPDDDLYEELITGEWNDKILTPSIEQEKITSYANKDCILEIDEDEEYHKGKVISIKVKNFQYDINVNRDLMAFKMKKSEFNNMSYRIFIEKDSIILAFRKRFKEPYGFDIIRLFQII